MEMGAFSGKDQVASYLSNRDVQAVKVEPLVKSPVVFRQDCRFESQYDASRPNHSHQAASGAVEHDPIVNSWEDGRRYMTRAGFRVRSKIERIIADFLHHEEYPFLYEPTLQFGGHCLHPDFYFTELHLPYEHFGLDTPGYLRHAALKIALYHKANAPFIYTTIQDETDIDDVLTEQLALFELADTPAKRKRREHLYAKLRISRF